MLFCVYHEQQTQKIRSKVLGGPTPNFFQYHAKLLAVSIQPVSSTSRKDLCICCITCWGAGPLSHPSLHFRQLEVVALPFLLVSCWLWCTVPLQKVKVCIQRGRQLPHPLPCRDKLICFVPCCHLSWHIRWSCFRWGSEWEQRKAWETFFIHKQHQYNLRNIRNSLCTFQTQTCNYTTKKWFHLLLWKRKS